MITPADALARLREGNRRFVENQTTSTALSHQARAALVAGQKPFAIALGCSDPRVPAELVFDQGFGDLFVIRVAGNVVAPSQVGSVEFAAARFGTRLVVVMGHSQCGAVVATLEELQEGTTNDRGTSARLPIACVRRWSGWYAWRGRWIGRSCFARRFGRTFAPPSSTYGTGRSCSRG